MEPVKNKTNNPNGRPKGSRNKLRVTDFFNGEERDRLVMEAKRLAFGDGESKPDKDMIKFLFEQLFGKATQRNTLEDENGNALTVIVPSAVAQAFNINASANTRTGDVHSQSEQVQGSELG